ncbi:MAG TPA: CehA/McbA family metallohydrolase, partial [Planctomycetota bacterium]|nr:CehA/McbA family metallohydrolase [Planctomycetota bacterium]
ISGETDFPCIYGERVGLGRIYCHLDGDLDFDRYADAIREGRSYVGDGRSHLLDFQVDDLPVGTKKSELRLDAPREVEISARVAAYLDPEPNKDIRSRPYTQQPYWHIERARLGEGRKVPLEVIVNGEVAARREIEADGSIREERFRVPIERSSWVALRILPSSHTNPVFVLVGDRPIRASRRSAEWCLQSVDRCWDQKRRRIRERELGDAERAYEHARSVYRGILSECEP